MSKAVVMQIGEKTMLVETDETIEIPAAQVSVVVPDRRIPQGAKEVVNIKEIQLNVAEVKDVIITCCNNLYNAIESIPKPERFAVEFGVKLAGEAGIPMLTKASGEANFKVTVEWKKQ